MRSSPLYALALILGITTRANAQPIKDSGPPQPERRLSTLGLSVRGGGVLHTGAIAAGVRADQILGPGYQLNLSLDLRLGSRLMLSPWVGYSKALAGPMMLRLCDGCGIGGLQVGALLRATWLRTRTLDAWAGYGYSRDYYFAVGSGASANFSGGHHHLTFGVDWFIDKTVDRRIGFYVDVAAGVFGKAEVTHRGRITHVADPQVHQTTSTGFQISF